MRKILLLLFSTSFSATSVPIVTDAIQQYKIDNGHIVDDKYSLNSFHLEKFNSILSKSMSEDEKIQKIVHDGINGLYDPEFQSDYGYFVTSLNELPDTFDIKHNTCDLSDNKAQDCSLSVYAKSTNPMFSGFVDLNVDIKYEMNVDWTAIDNLVLPLSISIDKEDPSISDIKNNESTIYKEIISQIEIIKDDNVLIDAFNALSWQITYPDRIISDGNGIYKVNSVAFKAKGNEEYKDAAFNVNVVVYVNRNNVEYDFDYDTMLTSASNWSTPNEETSTSGFKKIADISKLTENHANSSIYDIFSKLKINFKQDNKLKFWNFDGVLNYEIDSKILEMTDVKKSIDGNEKVIINIASGSGRSGLAYWETQVSVIFKVENNVLYANLENRVKIKIISSKSHSAKLEYGILNFEFVR
ncbi:hypothetical protein [Spiroplasma endosymbiont of Labia minor]|uniref:hypothetical protein n=1 Tax=Spiroplasma endosymbiont of Labia minor TaxID=3066305 RepID=UPI0030CB41BA